VSRPSASPGEVLRYIADVERLERTLQAFPGLTRDQVAQWLLMASRAFRPTAAPAERNAPAERTAPTERTAPAERTAPTERTVRVYSDGAARGNPGPAGAGAVVTDASGKVLAELGKYLGRQTNNHAEYMGLILGLEHAKTMGANEVHVFADSQLLIRQLEGKYKVKSETLRPLFERARALVQGFARVRLQHIPREENSAADEMSNRAIDERL
jgi:ribonuclease HI